MQHGSTALGNQVMDQLSSQGKRPTLIPVGGSNALGTWGYLEFMRELTEQTADRRFTDIIMVRFTVTLVVSQTKAAPLQIKQAHYIHPECHQHEHLVIGGCRNDDQVLHTKDTASIWHRLQARSVVQPRTLIQMLTSSKSS